MNNPAITSSAAFDVQSLDNLKRQARGGSQQALTATAHQMEGIFLQMMLKSMRDASIGDGLTDSDASKMYTSLYDQQIAQDVAANGGLGFAETIVRQLGGTPSEQNVGAISAGTAPYRLPGGEQSRAPLAARTLTQKVNNVKHEEPSHQAASASYGKEHFITRLLKPAMDVARQTGIPQHLIVAQAALESGWGNRVIPNQDGGNSHNLFGIKATSNWKGKTTEITTTEYVNGVAQKVKAKFRAYDSYTEALRDYSSLLASNPRYRPVTEAASPESAAHALQAGGYATDPHYAKKLINIIQKVKGTVEQGMRAYTSDISGLF